MKASLLSLVRRAGRPFLVVVLLSCVGVQGIAHAQLSNSSIARTYTVSGAQPVSGDLISLDRTSQELHLSSVVGDSTLFGAVVSNPVIILRSAGADVPIVTSGEVLVNVTTIAGAIAPGDLITTSSIAGKGQLATSTDAFIVGMALAAFPSATSTPVAGHGSVVGGSIPVLLEIGPYPATAHPAGAQSSGTSATAAAGKSAAVIGVSTFFRYLLAAIVAIGSIVVAFKNFGASINDSIISVGRNPLAKSSIQSMVILNALLIALVSAGGLFIGFAILFLPI